MKKLLSLGLLIAALAASAWGASWPSPTGAVNDFARVLSQDEAQDLEDYLDNFEHQTGNAIVVVTVPSVEGADVDRAAVELFQAWGIGQKGKDNGILVLVSVKDQKDRIEVGYGLEGTVTDADTGTIRRQEMEPYFKSGQFGVGLNNGAHSLAQLILQGQQGTAQANQAEEGLPLGEVVKTIIIIVLVILYVYIRFRFGGWWGGGFYRGGGGWGGGGFGGGGGGGFGGFGGGGSGGGGSSGGW